MSVPMEQWDGLKLSFPMMKILRATSDIGVLVVGWLLPSILTWYKENIMREVMEVTSPEDHFDNSVIKEHIKKVLGSKSRLFVKYDHYEIYELKLSGYSCGEIAKMYDVSRSFIAMMINWIELRLRKNLEFLI